MSLRILLPATLAAACGAMDIPAIDLLGGASANQGAVGVGIFTTDNQARDSGVHFVTTSISGTVSSVSAYPLAANPKLGGLLGLEGKLQFWGGSNHEVEWRAADLSASLVAGGYCTLTDTFRLALTGSAGPGLSWSKLTVRDESETDVGPSLNTGVVLEAKARSSAHTEIGVSFGYAYDYMPGVTSQGPYIAISATWIAGGGKK